MEMLDARWAAACAGRLGRYIASTDHQLRSPSSRLPRALTVLTHSARVWPIQAATNLSIRAVGARLVVEYPPWIVTEIHIVLPDRYAGMVEPG